MVKPVEALSRGGIGEEGKRRAVRLCPEYAVTLAELTGSRADHRDAPRMVPLSPTTPVDPLIFLDIDGVLNSTRFRAEHTGGDGAVTLDGAFDAIAHLDPRRVARLNVLVSRSGARVILSSSWRLWFGLENTERSLRERGFVHALSGATIRLVGRSRHDEIRHHLAALAQVPNFVVLDDEPEAGVGMGERFVHVPDGIEDVHVDRALRLLARDTPPTIDEITAPDDA